MKVREFIPLNVVSRLDMTQRLIMAVSTMLILLAKPTSGEACDPASYFLFRVEAEARLDSLQTNPTTENALERFVLMHNLAFHKDKNRREQAEKLLEKRFPKESRLPLIAAYAGSLKMIKVSHRTTSGKVFRTVNPLMKSPHAEAREGYSQISGAVKLDTSNAVIRILRATAGAESVEHLDELYDSTRIDLEWLQARTEPTDSVCQFLIHLNWAKYHFKLAKHNGSAVDLMEAMRHVEIAQEYACTPVYRDWVAEWRSKIQQLELDH